MCLLEINVLITVVSKNISVCGIDLYNDLAIKLRIYGTQDINILIDEEFTDTYQMKIIKYVPYVSNCH